MHAHNLCIHAHAVITCDECRVTLVLIMRAAIVIDVLSVNLINVLLSLTNLYRLIVLCSGLVFPVPVQNPANQPVTQVKSRPTTEYQPQPLARDQPIATTSISTTTDCNMPSNNYGSCGQQLFKCKFVLFWPGGGHYKLRMGVRHGGYNWNGCA